MTPKEKAKEIYCKYTNALNIRALQTTANPFAKQCALIAVYELIIQNGELYLNGLNGAYYTEKNNFLFEVKQEIEKL
jgi:hypothetical protein